jgi:hypothetical protein
MSEWTRDMAIATLELHGIRPVDYPPYGTAALHPASGNIYVVAQSAATAGKQRFVHKVVSQIAKDTIRGWSEFEDKEVIMLARSSKVLEGS